MERVRDLAPEFLVATWETIYLVAFGLTIGGAFGLLIGTTLYVTRKGGIAPQPGVNVLLNMVVNIFRPIPFVFLAVGLQPLSRALLGTGIGNTAAVVAIVAGSSFGIGRIVEQNLVSVPPGVLEAARAMGAGRLRVVLTVLLPEAFGPLILGYAFAFVAIVDMTAIVGTLGGGGLGNLALTYGYRQFNPWVTWTAIGIVIILVQLGQFVANTAARKVLRR